ncbi:MAG: hypothetical protein ABIP27_04615 [Flavobacterium circumlabens]|uniref:hypothetical protein n=1 Tax=Flavobacterium circumlabens TaxID=2133765 RepID=UPI003267B8F0
MIKKVLPFEELTYHSTLTKAALLAHLQNEIEAEKSFGIGFNRISYGKPYIGKIHPTQFEIKRAINYRNSFLPIIKGEIRDDISGSKIDVKMGLPDFVKVFMCIWLGIVFLVSLGTLYTLLFNNAINEGPFIFIPFVMLFAGVAMVVLGFKTESKKSITDLEQLLQAKRIQNNSRH